MKDGAGELPARLEFKLLTSGDICGNGRHASFVGRLALRSCSFWCWWFRATRKCRWMSPKTIPLHGL